MPTSQPDTAEFRADEGPLGLLQTDLRKLSYKLLELSILASETTDDTQSEPRVATKINDIISQYGDLDALRNVLDHKVPLQILRLASRIEDNKSAALLNPVLKRDIDAVVNPNLITKERIERAAAENQRIGGRLQAISTFKEMLESSLKDAGL